MQILLSHGVVIIGRGVLGSLSPGLHNAVYRALGLEALYLPFATESFATDVSTSWRSAPSGSHSHMGPRSRRI